MKFRVGAWMLVGAFCVLALVKLVGFGLPVATWAAEPLIWTIIGAWIVCVVGFATCARDSERGAATLFSLAALAASFPVIVGVWGIDGTAGRVLDTLGVTTHLAFAGAAMFRGVGKRLPWTLIPIAALFMIPVAVFGVSRGWPGFVPLDLMSMYIALDLLGAFPALGRVPQVAIPQPALGRVVTGIGFALIAVGGWLAWSALDEMTKRSMSSDSKLFYGMIAVLAGVLGLWRRRRNVSLPIAIAMVVVIGGSLETIGSLVKRPFEDAVLTTRELPTVHIALPSGTDTIGAFRDVGEVAIDADHVGLDSVGMGWGYREDADLQGSAFTVATAVNTDVSIAVYDDTPPHRTAMLVWPCDGVKMRASFGAKGSLIRVQQLATRIARSIECVAPSPSTPAIAISAALPAGFHEIPVDAGFRSFRSADDSIGYSLAWTKDRDWRTMIEDAPLEMFRWYVHPKSLEEMADSIRQTVLVTDGEYRWIAQGESGDRRRIVGVYYCRNLGIYAAAGYDGPASVSLDTALDLVRAARCP